MFKLLFKSTVRPWGTNWFPGTGSLRVKVYDAQCRPSAVVCSSLEASGEPVSLSHSFEECISPWTWGSAVLIEKSDCMKAQMWTFTHLFSDNNIFEATCLCLPQVKDTVDCNHRIYMLSEKVNK